MEMLLRFVTKHELASHGTTKAASASTRDRNRVVYSLNSGEAIEVQCLLGHAHRQLLLLNEALRACLESSPTYSLHQPISDHLFFLMVSQGTGLTRKLV